MIRDLGVTPEGNLIHVLLSELVETFERSNVSTLQQADIV